MLDPGIGALDIPVSGCDHFGISLAAGKTPGKTTYHWLVPGPQLGKLVEYGTVASLPSPVLNQLPPAPGAPPVVHAVAEAPEQPERLALNQFSDAYSGLKPLPPVVQSMPISTSLAR